MLRALDAVWLTPRFSTAHDRLLLAASTGYGVSGHVAGTDGVHHRAAGSLSLGVESRLGLAAELRFDGRWDVHRVSPRDDSLVGDPRLLVRYGRAVHPRAHLGAEVGVWTPGRGAPSLPLRATSVDLLVAGELRLVAWLDLTAALGPRLDQSAHSVDDKVVLSRSDRLSLGVSSYHAWLSRLALTARLADYLVSLELSADTLFGDGAPRAGQSPVRGALVARRSFARAPRLELSALLSTLLSSRPPFRADDYVPFEPRFSAWVGARYAFDRAAGSKGAHALDRPVSDARGQSAPVPPPPTTGSLLVTVLDERGSPLPDAAVVLEGVELRTGGTGEVSFSELTEGPHEVRTATSGFVPVSATVEVAAGTTAGLTVNLAPTREESLLRLHVRDLSSGAPLVARVSLLKAMGKRPLERFETAPNGRFELALPAGRYRVTVSRPGYQSQTRTVSVPDHGVALFNVDLLRGPK